MKGDDLEQHLAQLLDALDNASLALQNEVTKLRVSIETSDGLIGRTMKVDQQSPGEIDYDRAKPKDQ